MTSVIEAILKLRPNAEVIISNNDYTTAIWHKIEGEIPTQAEIETTIKNIEEEKIKAEQEKQTKRFAALAKLESLGLNEDDLKALGL